MGGAELVGRPIDTSDAIEIHSDLGTSDSEVEENLGIDVGERRGAPLFSHEVDRRRC